MPDAMDMNAYNELKEIMGEVLHDLIDTFLETMPEQLSLLQQALQQNNSEQVFAVAHRIKSSSSSIGAASLADYAEQLELKGRAAELGDSEALYATLLEHYGEAAEFLRSELKS